MLTQDALTESFENLRRSARTKEDLRAWFLAHPEVLTEGEAIPRLATVTLDLTINKGTALLAAEDGALTVNYSFQVANAYDAHPVLLRSGVKRGKMSGAEKKYSGRLHLSIEEWPFAAAYVAGCYVETWFSPGHTVPTSKLQGLLNSFLPKHFAGLTLESIFGWQAAELIPCIDNRHPKAHEVAHVLFMSRDAVPRVELPDMLTS